MRRLLKRILVTAAIVAGLAIAALIAIIAWHLIHPEWTHNHIKPSSPFHPYVTPSIDRQQEGAIRAHILSELPLGSDMAAIKGFIDRHFINLEVRKQTVPLEVDYPEANPPHIALQLWSSGRFPSGSDWLDLVLVLDDSDRLKDVLVSCNGAWL